MDSTSVLIAGAGPVGLTLAIELGQQGIDVLVAEKRPQFGKLPKMERCNARTMENFRRMGIADHIRAAGLDNDMPMDVFICWENITNPPLVQHKYASVRELQREYEESFDGTKPAEPYQLISQYTLEPVLLQIAESIPGVRVAFGTEVVDFEQRDESVISTLSSVAGDVEHISGIPGRMRRSLEHGSKPVGHRPHGRDPAVDAPGPLPELRLARQDPHWHRQALPHRR